MTIQCSRRKTPAEARNRPTAGKRRRRCRGRNLQHDYSIAAHDPSLQPRTERGTIRVAPVHSSHLSCRLKSESHRQMDTAARRKFVSSACHSGPHETKAPATSLPRFLLLSAYVLLTACTTSQQRRAQENEAIQMRAAKEIARICALPQSDRQAEIDKIKKESGIVVYCGGS